MDKHKFYIIDFDSTFIKCEALDLLSRICLQDNPRKDTIVKEIERITRLGMEGKIPFQESLSLRLSLMKPRLLHIHLLTKLLKREVTSSFRENRSFFKTYASQVYLVSGGFREFIEPVAAPYGIQKDHILANTFVTDKLGNIAGYDKSNPLSRAGGKAMQVKSLKLQGTIIVIGDGWSDYEIKKQGAARYFVAYIEHARRKSAIQYADKTASCFDEFLQWQETGI